MSLVQSDETKLSKYHLVPLDQDFLNNVRVTISLQKQGRHSLTNITGLDSKLFDLKALTSKLKKFIGGGGAVKSYYDKDGKTKIWVIGIQGDCRIDAKLMLVEKLLISDFNICIMGV